MKAKRRWEWELQWANRLANAANVMPISDDYLWLWRYNRAAVFFWKRPGYFLRDAYRAAASLALDGMPSTPKRPRAAGKGGRHGT